MSENAKKIVTNLVSNKIGMSSRNTNKHDVSEVSEDKDENISNQFSVWEHFDKKNGVNAIITPVDNSRNVQGYNRDTEIFRRKTS